MTQVKVQLAEAMETSLITLYGKALDARHDPTILGDTMAAEAVDKIDYDFTRLKVTRKNAAGITARAKHFDDWTTEFLAQHERATVVHLGAGLDTRVWRVDPGPNVSWYDVDHPEVVDVRSKVFPQREHHRTIGSSVTAPDWLQQVPADQPTLITAEGLSMYLRPEEGHELFRRIANRFPRGVIVLDTHNWLAIRLMNKKLARGQGRTLLHWGINHSFELERANPALRCSDAVSALFAPSSAALPRSTRIFAALSQPVPALRDFGLYLRYEIDSAKNMPSQPNSHTDTD